MATKKTPVPAPANPNMPKRDYVYDANVVEVTDGDTIKLDVDLGCDVWMRSAKLRLSGINAPEKNTPEGANAKAYLTALLPAGTAVRIETVKDQTEKYGRYMATVYVDTLPTTVSDHMVEKGYAKPWNGKGTRPV